VARQQEQQQQYEEVYFGILALSQLPSARTNLREILTCGLTERSNAEAEQGYSAQPRLLCIHISQVHGNMQ
jgi:hypothetical protein